MSRVFRYLLRLYPPAYRREYSDEMIAVFSEVRAEAGNKGVLARSVFCICELAGLLRGALQAALAQARAGLLGSLGSPSEIPA